MKTYKYSQGGYATPPKVPKLSVSSVKDADKTMKYWGMPCCVHVEYSAFDHLNLFLDYMKIIFLNVDRNKTILFF